MAVGISFARRAELGPQHPILCQEDKQLPSLQSRAVQRQFWQEGAPQDGSRAWTHAFQPVRIKTTSERWWWWGGGQEPVGASLLNQLPKNWLLQPGPLTTRTVPHLFPPLQNRRRERLRGRCFPLCRVQAQHAGGVSLLFSLRS